MAKLSPAQDTAIRGLSNGAFPKGTRRSTIDVLLAGDYVVFYSDNGSYDYGKAGREYLGTNEAQTINATVEEVLTELDTNPWDAPQNDTAKPFTVQELIGNVWTRIERAAATWGTANVWRNRMASQGLTVRVHNTISDQVWA